MLDRIRFFTVVWAVLAIPMGLVQGYVWVRAPKLVEMSCGDYIRSGCSARWVKLADCDAHRRQPVYFSSGGTGPGPVPKQYVQIFAREGGSSGLVYAFNARVGDGPPMPVHGMKEDWMIRLLARSTRSALRERFGLPDDFVIINADRKPSLGMALGLLLSGAVCAVLALIPSPRKG